jgi:hypothetical protein
MTAIPKFTRPTTLDEAIQLSAKLLPVGYKCQLTIERDGYDFQLITPTGEEYSFCSDDDIRGHFVDHLELALELAAKEEA